MRAEYVTDRMRLSRVFIKSVMSDFCGRAEMASCAAKRSSGFDRHAPDRL